MKYISILIVTLWLFGSLICNLKNKLIVRLRDQLMYVIIISIIIIIITIIIIIVLNLLWMIRS